MTSENQNVNTGETNYFIELY